MNHRKLRLTAGCLAMSLLMAIGPTASVYASEISGDGAEAVTESLSEDSGSEQPASEEIDIEDTAAEDTTEDTFEQTDPEEQQEQISSEPEEDEDAEDSDIIETTETESLESEMFEVDSYYINPLYADEVTLDDLQDPSMYGIMLLTEIPYRSTYEEAAADMREYLVERITDFDVCMTSTEAYSDNMLRKIFSLATEHTGIGNEGDYLKWHYAGWKAHATYYVKDGIYYYTYSYTMTYYTDMDQEEEVADKISGILSSLGISGKSDYEKIEAVYRYIIDHVSYDFANDANSDYKLKYTAYGALFTSKAVCQGYAVLFYRMMLDCGIDCRMVTGSTGGVAHGWNIVKLNGRYYYCDPTWDSNGYHNFVNAGGESADYVPQYFLCGENSVFNNGATPHELSSSFTTSEFVSRYPIAEENYPIPGSKEPEIPEDPELPESSETYRVTAKLLNVRSGPDTSYSKIGTLDKGEEVEVFGIENDKWARIDYQGQTGYIYMTYCEKVEGSESEEPEEPAAQNPVYTITANQLNVRKGPSTSYAKLGTLSKGEQVEVTEVQNGWGRINYQGNTGWISLTYCKKTEESQTTTTERPTTTTTEKPTTTTTEAPGTSGTQYKITASSLNLRSGPGTGYSKVGVLSANTVVTVYESRDGWGRILYQGKDAWLSLKYCSKISQKEDTPAAQTNSYKVTATTLNVRSGAGSSYSKLGSLSSGQLVEVLEIKNGWGKISYNGKYGWISLTYCKKI